MPVDRARDFDVGKDPDHGRPEEYEGCGPDEDWPALEPPLATCSECGVFFYGLPKACPLCPGCCDEIYGITGEAFLG